MIEIFHFGLIRYFNNNNQQHRANGLPSTIWSDGVGCEYRVKGERHRLGGLPANIYLELDDYEQWCVNKEYWKHGYKYHHIIVFRNGQQWKAK